MLPGSMHATSHKQLSGLSLFTLQYPQTPFSREGAEILTSLYIDEISQEAVAAGFINIGPSYYMTAYFLKKTQQSSCIIYGLLHNLGGVEKIEIGGREGYILTDPKGMVELARRVQMSMEAFAKENQNGSDKSAKPTSCNVEQLARKLPEKQLKLAGIELYRNLAIAELGLSENDVLYYTMKGGSPSDQRKQFKDRLQAVLSKSAGYIFCNDGKHTNLISYREIAGEKYFFICDSKGFELEKSREEKIGDQIMTVIIIGQELINLQIDVITVLGHKAVISTETRQHNMTSCPAFAREDLRVLHHYDHWHSEILRQSTATKANPNLLIFSKFPAQMLLLWQVSIPTLLNDPRSKYSVTDRDGEQGQLGQLLMRKHYDRARGLNIYARTLIDDFLDNIWKPACRLATPVSVCVAPAAPCETTSSALALSLIGDARADVSIIPGCTLHYLAPHDLVSFIAQLSKIDSGLHQRSYTISTF